MADFCEQGNEHSDSIKGNEFLHSRETIKFSRRTPHHTDKLLSKVRERKFSGILSFYRLAVTICTTYFNVHISA
jgi:hypothetical protein